METIDVTGAKRKMQIRPQQEVRKLTVGPGKFSENIPLKGEVPKGQHWLIHTLIRIRPANEDEIKAFEEGKK